MSVRMRVDVKLNRAAMNRLTRSPDGVVGRAMVRGGDRIVRRAKQNVDRYGRVYSGDMRDTIKAEPPQVTNQGVAVAIVAPVRYARYQHDGTKRGIKPAPFLADAMNTAKPADFL